MTKVEQVKREHKQRVKGEPRSGKEKGRAWTSRQKQNAQGETHNEDPDPKEERQKTESIEAGDAHEGASKYRKEAGRSGE